MEVYPNPAAGEFICKYELDQNLMVGISIYSLDGRTVLSIPYEDKQAGMYSIPVHNIPAGMYFATVNINGKIYTTKLISTSTK